MRSDETSELSLALHNEYCPTFIVETLLHESSAGIASANRDRFITSFVGPGNRDETALPEPIVISVISQGRENAHRPMPNDRGATSTNNSWREEQP